MSKFRMLKKIVPEKMAPLDKYLFNVCQRVSITYWG